VVVVDVTEQMAEVVVEVDRNFDVEYEKDVFVVVV
jgi:hypothetical protein